MKSHNTNTISSFEAKTHFADLLRRVGAGEKITILKHNNPVAIMIPTISEKQIGTKQVIKELQSFCKGKILGDLNIRDLIDEGRR